MMMSVAAESEHAADYDFVPRTFIFPQDAMKFVAYQARHKNATFIAKPTTGGCGDSIAVFNDLRQVP